jgi:hypothetical protein
MANKFSPHLYDLVHSLSSSERRYFKLYVASHIGKHNDLCVKLFGLMVRSEGKSLEKIEAKITFTKHPSRLKNYLYDLILKSLESYHSKSSITIKIRKLINQIENVYNKALYEQCIVLAKKSLKEAEKIDHQNFKIDILDWYLNALRQLENKKFASLHKELQTKQQDAINKLRLEKEYKKINQSTFQLTKRFGTLRSVEDADRLKEMMDNPLLSDYSLATSFYSKTNFNTTQSNYFKFIGDTKKTNYYQKQNLLLYEDYPARIDLDQYNYITALNNYSLSCSDLGDYEKADYYFSKMEKLTPFTNQVDVKIFEYLSANRLDLYLRSGQLDKALEQSIKIEADLIKHGKRVTALFKTVVQSNLCYLFLATGHYRKALQYNNHIIDEDKVNYRSDIFRFARIMNLIVHYELNDQYSIEYFYEATERFINKQIEIYAFERWFLTFFKTLIKTNEADKQAFFKAREVELLAVFEDVNERKVISHFNILAWIRTKYESISFDDAIMKYEENDFVVYSQNRN